VARLQVSVVSPEREVFSGQADMVVARGREGEVGILPGHAPMLVELDIAPVRLLEGDREIRKILVDGGFLHVMPEEEETRVDILAEHAALPDEVDAATARARADELLARLQDEDQAELQTELARTVMRAEHGRG
jgi:F-type H+-transporting ATPase subunit epsilon